MERAPVSKQPRTARFRLPWYLIAIAVLISVRLLHLRPILDGPHQPRQADTAFCAYGFYKYDFNIMHPSVCWRGAYRLCALEFPIHEFVTATFYKIFGPNLVIARLVTLAFFVGSAWYFHLVVRHVAGTRLARLATLFYCAFPLGIVYSRAVHIDFSAVFFAHATLYYLLRACDRPGLLYPLLATVAGVCAWMVKVPYVFYLYLPLACYALRSPWCLRRLVRLAVPTVIALLAFVAWRDHSYRINAGVPDWPYVDKMVDMGEWYFGTLAQRQDSRNWLEIGRHLYTMVFRPFGLALLALGFVGAASRRPDRWFWWSWAAGTAGYVAVFFNLNVIHDYYQIPILAIAAVLLATGIVWIEQKLQARAPQHVSMIRTLVGAFTTAALGGLVWSGETLPGAYWVDKSLHKAGAIIRQRTPDDALVIATVEGNTGTNMPLLLYAGRRLGWSLPGDRVLEPGVLDAYRQAGATCWAVVLRQPIAEGILPQLGLPEPYIEPLGRNWWLNLVDLRAADRR